MQATYEMTITRDAYTYTLSHEGTEDHLAYTLTATYLAESRTLHRFTTDEDTAHTFLHLVAAGTVSPCHLHDIWQDYNA